jgi:predicted permease
LTDRAGAQISAQRRKAILETTIPLLPGGAGLSDVRRAYETPLTVLMIMVGVVLLIACANLANLMLARAAGREREFSARLALGSSRGRIVRQILTEALVLAFAGGALGLGIAFWATRLLIRFIDHGAAHTALKATPDWRVLVFTLTTCMVTGALFGIAPAWRSSRSNAAASLSANARTTAAGRRGRLLPRGLIVAQVTLSLVLLTVAGLLLRTLENLRSKDLGFDQSNVLMIQTNPKFAGYTPERLNALYESILERVDALPGVRAASIAGGPPISRGNWGSPITIAGRPTTPNEDVGTMLNRVSAGYFETLGIPLLRGRTIGAGDTAGGVKAAVVNQTLVDRYFPNGDAIGRTFQVADPGAGGPWQIVGVVRDAKYHSPADKPQPFTYLALTQLTGDDQYGYLLQVRTVGDPAKMARAVRAALAEIDPNLPILETRTMAEHVDSLMSKETFISQLSGFFALLAVSLAAIGLYGVMTYNVVRRTNELGVRMALGASRSGILWMVLNESVVLLAIGVALGIPVSLAASRAIQAGLFEVSPSDPLMLAGAVVAISLVLMVGSYLPARRATKIDPMVALRCE